MEILGKSTCIRTGEYGKINGAYLGISEEAFQEYDFSKYVANYVNNMRLEYFTSNYNCLDH